MRKELLGPAPLAIGVAIVAAALLLPAQAPPCQCSVLTPREFEALDAGGYPGVAAGDTIVVDGRVTSIQPSPLVSAPFRTVQLEGSQLRLNVTGYNANTGPVGEWVRLSAVHAGENEAAGPDLGHRWSHLGKTVPPGGSVISLAGLALGLVVAAWGAATWRESSRTGARAAALKARVARAREARAADPAGSKSAAMGKELAGASAMLRRGQYDSAQTAVEGVEAALARSRRVKEALDTARKALEAEERRGTDARVAREQFDVAEASYTSGEVPDAEMRTSVAFGLIENTATLREFVEVVTDALAKRAAASDPDEATAALLADAKEKVAAGKVPEALAAAEKAFHSSRDNLPRARGAAAEIARLKDFLQLHPEFDRTREVRDRVRDADELYRLGQFARATAEARVGIWLADPDTLSAGEFEAIVRSRYAKLGYEVDPAGAMRPPFGFLAARLGVTAVIVTSTWRDFPAERVIFALKDLIAEGGAARAVVYSSAFTNTSTDARIEVVGASALVELLRDAALSMTA